MDSAPRPRLFLSYARSDEAVATELAGVLSAKGFDPWFDLAELRPGESLEKNLRNALQHSDFFVVLISSDREGSGWSSWELAEATRPQHRARQMAIVPVLVGDASLPSDLSRWSAVPLVGDDGAMGSPVVRALQRLNAIDFSTLEPSRFEDLVADLLPALGFDTVRALGFDTVRDTPAAPGPFFDFEARLELPNPFGQTREEVWMIEVKHLRSMRVSTGLIADVAGRLLFLPPGRRAAIITSGILTSAAREFLDGAVRERSPNLQVVESDDLRRLVARFPDLVDRYFPDTNATA